ncbi:MULTISPECIES: 4Fe-4S binding protein [unclassified Fusibacter]|uniref:4Fe-4S binding protein n=1 Tax=unclassified Fusibacter TaxID=2624464 RepID=UPI0013E98BF6|nr:MULTISPECIES: 4Fe-4S binding protein [unclassified Fusibacter]MCK8061592.1 4Fe-4S binding protein [Fusibacter sp. A2]NPE23775.1 4Fe-4S binding protein [Fusibacter sp. A1]
MKNIIKYRKSVQFAFGGVTVYVIMALANGLAYVFGASILLGAIFGKTYCKWMCPMGLVMEHMSRNLSDNEAKVHMYNYYKVGCPVSWVQGVTNKFSLFKIRNDESKCVSCGACDKVCYVSAVNTKKSVFDTSKENACEAFNCSKCLSCVEACPTESLQYKIK